MFKILLQFKLKILAKLILKKYKPRVVGITGSVGKTSVKLAAGAALSKHMRAYVSLKSYNNEIGVPLAIIGVESPGRSLSGWVAVGLKALWLILKRHKHYPEVLILEMGADKPGDLDYLLDLAPVQIGVLTGIGPTHTEFFKSVKRVLTEKQKLILRLPVDGIVILNADDEQVMSVKDKIKAKILTYGFAAHADVRIVELKVHFPQGMQFKILYKGSMVPLAVNGVLGESAVSSVLGGVAIGLALEVNLVDIARGFENYEPPPGRMRVIYGIKNTFIIDDTYNSSPKAVFAALKALQSVDVPPPAEKWAVLGDMKELGELSEQAHKEVGQTVAQAKIGHLVCVGELAKDIATGAKGAGMDEELIFEFANNEETGKFIQEKLRPGSVVLVKGSRLMHMEQIVRELMAEPQDADKLLINKQ